MIDMNYTVVQLNAKDLTAIKDHLLRLDSEGRRMRFFSAISDEGIGNYVDRISWENDTCFGVFNLDQLVAFAHMSPNMVRVKECELGISIDYDYRRKGLGKQMMKRVMTFAKARGIEVLIMECLRQNMAMRDIATACGMQTVVDEDTAITQVAIKTTFGDRMLEIHKDIVYENLALVDGSVRRFYNNLTAMIKFPCN